MSTGCINNGHRLYWTERWGLCTLRSRIAQCKIGSLRLNTGIQNDACVHGPCPRPVNTDDTRVYGPCWIHWWYTGVIFWHPFSWAVSTAREHGRHLGHPCPRRTRPVDTGSVYRALICARDQHSVSGRVKSGLLEFDKIFVDSAIKVTGA